MKLDDLPIILDDKSSRFVDDPDVFDSGETVESFCILLKKLYLRGFYNRLHLSIQAINSQPMAEIVTFPALFQLFGSLPGSDLPLLTSVEQLDLSYSNFSFNTEIIFPNLKRVSFACTVSDNILYMIRCAPKLKKMKVNGLRNGLHLDGRIVDLYAFNKERKKVE